MDEQEKEVIWLFITILAIAQVSALLDSGSQTNINPSNSIEISYPKLDTIKITDPFNFSVRAYNVTSGLELSSATCSMILYNFTGQAILTGTLKPSVTGYYFFIKPGNFTGNNLVQIDAYCNDTNIGGFESQSFSLTSSGLELSTSKAILYAMSDLTMFLTTLLFFLLSLSVNVKTEISLLGGKAESKKASRSAKILKFSLLGLSIVTGLLTIFYASVSVSSVMPEFSQIINSYNTFQWLMLLSLFLLVIFIFLALTMELIHKFKVSKGLIDEHQE